MTTLGLVIGISAVIAMVSAGGGARAKLGERLESVGKDLILIRAGARNQQGAVTGVGFLGAGVGGSLRDQVSALWPLRPSAAPASAAPT